MPYGNGYSVHDKHYYEDGLGSECARVYMMLATGEVHRGCWSGPLEDFISQVELSYATGYHSRGVHAPGRFFPESTALAGYREAFPRFRAALAEYQAEEAEKAERRARELAGAGAGEHGGAE